MSINQKNFRAVEIFSVEEIFRKQSKFFQSKKIFSSRNFRKLHQKNFKAVKNFSVEKNFQSILETSQKISESSLLVEKNFQSIKFWDIKYAIFILLLHFIFKYLFSVKCQSHVWCRLYILHENHDQISTSPINFLLKHKSKISLLLQLLIPFEMLFSFSEELKSKLFAILLFSL